MRADIHDGPEHMLQSETEYIDASPGQPASTKASCTARPDHTLGSASEVSAFEGQVCITPMNGHRQFDWVASRNMGRQLGRAVDIPGVHPSEPDASQLLR